MPDIAIKITNLPEIKRAFGKAPEAMTKELNVAIGKVLLTIQGKEILQYRSLGIRVITGGLINSIRRGLFQANLIGEVGPNVTNSPGVDYAGYVHSGTRYMAARPFLLNAVTDSAPEIEVFFRGAVQKVLDDIGKSV